MNFERSRDLDIIRDLDFYTTDKVLGTESGLSGFIEGRFQYFSMTAKAGYMRNYLFDETYDFDKKYVQLLPKIQLGSTPFTLLQTDYFFLRRFNLVLNSDLSIFKNRLSDSDVGQIRNVSRLNVNPYIDWQLGRLGPIKISHRAQLDNQYYLLRQNDTKNFQKRELCTKQSSN